MEGDAFFRYPVVAGPGRALLQREPKEVGSIQPVHRWPAVQPVVHVGGNLLFARNANEAGHEAIVAIAVHRGG